MILDEETKANLDGEVGKVIVAAGNGSQHIQLEDVQATELTYLSTNQYFTMLDSRWQYKPFIDR